MENRWAQRTPVQLNLIIHYGPLGLIRATSKDISSNGMFIDTGRIILSPDEIIELTFTYPNSSDGMSCTVPANIVHSSEHGSGVEFINQTLNKSDYIREPSFRKAASY